MKKFLIPLFLVLLLAGCLLTSEGENNPPTVSFKSAPTSGNTGSTMTYEAIGSDDNSNIKSYKWKVNGTELNESGAVFDTVFNDPNDYKVEVKAIDDNGDESEWKSVTTNIVETNAPIAELSASNAIINEQITFTVTNKGTGNLTKAYWTIDGKDTTTNSGTLKWTFSSTKSSIEIKVYIENDKDKTSATVSKSISVSEPGYPVHENVKASTFWVGEAASSHNGDISNLPSSWDSDWATHFGLEDHPTKCARDSDQIPTDPAYKKEENPYYFALPYNDFTNLSSEDKDGNQVFLSTDSMVNGSKWGRKKNASEVIYWADEKSWSSSESMCKNRWIKIVLSGFEGNEAKTCYAQWEDSGPYYYNDHKYVFGTDKQQNNYSPSAGIDLSPSVGRYLGLPMESWGAPTYSVNWQFIDAEDVPEGPWKKYVTTRQVNW